MKKVQGLIGKIAGQLEDSNLASSLELDVLVHVEEEHERGVEPASRQHVPDLVRMITMMMMLLMMMMLTMTRLTSCPE